MKICTQNVKGQERYVNLFSVELLRTVKQTKHL